MNRAISIGAGVAVSLTLHNAFGMPDIYALVTGFGVTFFLQYVFGVARRSRKFQREMDRLVEDHKQGGPLIDDEGRHIDV
jgi:hypothetical protein